jgi:hypothetical protein
MEASTCSRKWITSTNAKYENLLLLTLTINPNTNSCFCTSMPAVDQKSMIKKNKSLLCKRQLHAAMNRLWRQKGVSWQARVTVLARTGAPKNLLHVVHVAPMGPIAQVKGPTTQLTGTTTAERVEAVEPHRLEMCGDGRTDTSLSLVGIL